MTENETAAVRAANAAITAATDHIKGQRELHRLTRLKAYCLTAFACVLAICAAVVACFAIHAQQQTIIEQQYALNMQYAGLLDLMNGAEITTTTTTTTEEAYTGDGDNGTAFIGDGNTVIGGDMNGNG